MQKLCSHCGQTFEITDDDLQFYDSVSPVFSNKKYAIPPPTLCFDCRQQRRMAWRNEKRLYHRKCDLTGKQILSIYSPDKPYTVYEHHEWYTDKWNPIDYGREYDFGKTFFEQFDALHHVCPLRSFNLQEQSENSDYTNLANRNKNCYLIFAATDNEDCYYSTYVQRNKNAVDCFFTFESELCYECIDCYNCYHLTHGQYCQNCSNSSLLFDCRGCSDCFASAALVNKQYHILNKPYAKEEYEKIVSGIQGNRTMMDQAQNDFTALKLTVPHKYYAGLSNENVIGDHISYSKNTHHSFDCTYLEDCEYCTWFHQSQNCRDCYAWGFDCSLGYENHLCGNRFQNVCFSESCWNDISNLFYCRYCLDGCKDCFGCVSLLHKQYCILNKQFEGRLRTSHPENHREHSQTQGVGRILPCENFSIRIQRDGGARVFSSFQGTDSGGRIQVARRRAIGKTVSGSADGSSRSH
ncbi:hypothetical protein HY213_04105 [Candidatus Peregrinibacteria bacterium]|nr:hypothetical protein [Candidatus Peregrinibacteria bacterium]